MSMSLVLIFLFLGCYDFLVVLFMPFKGRSHYILGMKVTGKTRGCWSISDNKRTFRNMLLSKQSLSIFLV